jgi:SAM-dependent methyltransferase
MFLFFKKALHSYLTPRFLFDKVIKNKEFDDLLKLSVNQTSLSYKISRRLRKMLFFWPTIIDADTWIEGDFGKYRDPTHFKDFRPGIDILLMDKILECSSNVNAPILDLGCNSGRHIEYLYKQGLRNLTGVDIMNNALLFFKDRCPEIHKNTILLHDYFQRFLRNSPDKQYEIVYSVGATIELVHPSFDIIGEMCRVSSSYVMLLVQENNHSYPRFYISEFNKNKYTLIHSIRPILEGDKSVSLLVFNKSY